MKSVALITFTILFSVEFAFSSMDIPNLDANTARWLMPADSWEFREQHSLKGRFFRISKPDSADVSFDIFKDSALDGKPEFTFSNGGLRKDNKHVCENRSPYKRYSSEKDVILQCFMFFCSTDIDKGAHEAGIFSDSEYLLNVEKFEPKCSHKLDFASKRYAYEKNKDSIYDVLPFSQNTDYGVNYYFPFLGATSTALQVNINGSTYYLSLSTCKNKAISCEEVSIDQSDFEKDYARLETNRTRNDGQYFKQLISELLPCVKRRDEKCISKFFPQSEDELARFDLPPWIKFQKVKIDEDLLTELEACLDYKSLLPHHLASKGNKKVCILNYKADVPYKNSGKGKEMVKSLQIVNVTYPEAVRIGEKEAIYHLMK